jgi:hypothetical protein
MHRITCHHFPLYRRVLIGMLLLTLAAACAASPTPVLPEKTSLSPTTASVPVLTSTPGAAVNLTSVPTVVTSPPQMPTPSNAANVDASTLKGKVIFGYQGWFSCPGDGSKINHWVHWFKDKMPPVNENLHVDFWPDISEIGPSETCQSDMKMPDGSPAMLYSSYNSQTTDRHFQWMKEYGIDGIALQRFVSGLNDPAVFDFRNRVTINAMNSAEKYGRVFFIEYDFSGNKPANYIDFVKKDWAYLVDTLKVTSNPRYLHEKGRPLVGLYGFGLTGDDAIPSQAQEMIDFFKSTASTTYLATVMGGVPAYWRTGTHDAMSGTDWAAVFRSYDVLSPWTVGRYHNNSEADAFSQNVIMPDIQEAADIGAMYMPVVYPGFSRANLTPGSPLNQIPRMCGQFYWHQVYNAISAGAPALFVAMFDEMDEGTAMFKQAATQQQLPEGANLVPLDADGCSLPSDFYLKLGGATGEMLRGQISLSLQLPVQTR